MDQQDNEDDFEPEENDENMINDYERLENEIEDEPNQYSSE